MLLSFDASQISANGIAARYTLIRTRFQTSGKLIASDIYRSFSLHGSLNRKLIMSENFVLHVTEPSSVALCANASAGWLVRHRRRSAANQAIHSAGRTCSMSQSFFARVRRKRLSNSGCLLINMKRFARHVGVLLALLCVLSSDHAFTEEAAPGLWNKLLDKELSQWEVFMGVPHTSVNVDWPSKSESGTEGRPMGLNNDPLKVFSVKEVDGHEVLCISGQIYGGLTSRKEFENYHLSLQFKWGEKKWAPREDQKRDSGLLVHCTGEHGAFWNVWMRSLECQIQEDDCGDFIALAGSGCDIRVRRVEGSDRPIFDSTQPLFHGTGYVTHGPSQEKPNGDWNTVEVYSLGQTTVFVVNGTPNMVIERTVQNTGDGWKPLTKGKLQIQSEAAEIYYRDIKIRPLESFPESLQSITQPYTGTVNWFK
jgi:hypothetical protein